VVVLSPIRTKMHLPTIGINFVLILSIQLSAISKVPEKSLWNNRMKFFFQSLHAFELSLDSFLEFSLCNLSQRERSHSLRWQDTFLPVLLGCLSMSGIVRS
jgi:hypothetical protein